MREAKESQPNCPKCGRPLALISVMGLESQQCVCGFIMDEATLWLEDPALLFHIQDAVCQRKAEKGFVIGEEDNALQLYFDIIQNQSVEVEGQTAGGKNNLVDAVLRVCPPEWYRKLTSITPKYLRYLKENPPRILYIAERKGLENGQETTAEYDIKVAISEEGLTVGFVANSDTGNESKENEIRVGTFITTTTDIEGPEELDNRLDGIHVHDSNELNAEVRDAKLKKATQFPWEKADYSHERKVAQRMTRLIDKEAPKEVVIPYALALKQILGADKTAVRRHTDKILNMIRASARIHYRQRRVVEGQDGQRCLIANPMDLLIVLNVAGENLRQKFDALTEKMVLAIDLCRELARGDKPITTSAILALAKETKLSQLSGQRTIQGLVKALRDRGVLVPKFNRDGAPAKGEHGAQVYDLEEENAQVNMIDTQKVMAAADEQSAAWFASNPNLSFTVRPAPTQSEARTSEPEREALESGAIRQIASDVVPDASPTDHVQNHGENNG